MRQFVLPRWEPSSLRRTGVVMAGVGWLILTGGRPLWRWLPEDLLLIAFAVSLPWIFAAFRPARLDRAIGELSYPMYLLHWHLYGIGVVICRVVAAPGTALYAVLFPISAVLLSVATALLVRRWIEQPIDRFRQRRVAVLARNTGSA